MPYINRSFICCTPYSSSIYPLFLNHALDQSFIRPPGSHHPPRTASGRPATPEAARDWVVPGDNSKDHQAPTRHHIAGTKPFGYNQGCKRFCTPEPLSITSNIKTEALTEDPNSRLQPTQEHKKTRTPASAPRRKDST